MLSMPLGIVLPLHILTALATTHSRFKEKCDKPIIHTRLPCSVCLTPLLRFAFLLLPCLHSPLARGIPPSYCSCFPSPRKTTSTCAYKHQSIEASFAQKHTLFMYALLAVRNLNYSVSRQSSSFHLLNQPKFFFFVALVKPEPRQFATSFLSSRKHKHRLALPISSSSSIQLIPSHRSNHHGQTLYGRTDCVSPYKVV